MLCSDHITTAALTGYYSCCHYMFGTSGGLLHRHWLDRGGPRLGRTGQDPELSTTFPPMRMLTRTVTLH